MLKKPMVLQETRQFSNEGFRKKRNPAFDGVRESGSPAQEAWRQMMEARGVLVQHAGPIGLELARAEGQLDLDDEQMPEALEGLMNFQDFQEKGVDFLKKLGVVEREGGFIIVDLDKFDEINSSLLREGVLRRDKTKVGGKRVSVMTGRISGDADGLRKMLKSDFSEYWSDNAADLLFDVFYGQKVVSKEDWDNYQKSGDETKIPTPKDLFYNPRDNDEAFDVRSIKKANFHLGLWQLHGRKSRGDSYSRFHPDLNMMEMALACALYHPNFGNGERDENGNLQVTYKEKKKTGSGNWRRPRRNLSIDWMVNNAPFSNMSSDAPLETRRQYLRTPEVLQEGAFPHLAESRNGRPPLLRPEDFTVLSTSEYAKKFGVALPIRGTDRSALVTIEHVRYNLGAEFSDQRHEFEKYAVYKISDSLAGIVEKDKDTGAEKLVKTFSLVATDDPRAKRVGTGHKTFYYSVGAKEMGMENFTGEEETFLQRRPDESENNFVERKKAFDFATMLKLKQDIVRETGVSLQGLSPREQQAFLGYYRSAKEGEKDKFYQFVKMHRERGLKTFLAAEYDAAAGAKILESAENLPAAEMGVIFEKFNSMVILVDKIDEEVKGFFFDESKIRHVDHVLVAGEMIRRAVKLLEDYAEVKNKKTRKTLVELIMELERVKEEVIFLGAVIKNLPREAVADLNLKEMPAIEKITNITGAELSTKRELVEKMKIIIRKQFPGGDDEEFEKEITGNNNIRFTISLVDGEVVSFFAKKKIGENLDYLDWFISNPDTPIKGLGEATIKLGIGEDEKNKHSYYAVAKPHVKSFQILVESLGFSAFAGSTADGEYKHHYARVSRLSEDGELAAKSMDYEQKAELKRIAAFVCVEPNKTQSVLFSGTAFNICRIEFSMGIRNSDDVTESEPDGWIMAEIKRQYEKGNILTSFMPESGIKDNKVFYAVFEKDINASGRKEIGESLRHAA